MEIDNKKEEIHKFIGQNPGLTFKRIRFFLELNESTLNNALKSLIKGLLKLEVNRQIIETELNNHWEVLAEAIQVVLRKAGYPKPYEKLKQLTRGEKVTKAGLQKFIGSLKIDKTEKATLLKLTPEKYIGLAVKLVDKYLDK